MVDKDQQEYQDYLDYHAYTQYKSKFNNAPQAKSEDYAADAKTALEGFGQTATLGHLAQLQALAEPAQTKISNLITGKNVPLPDYTEARDENLARQAAQSRDNPISSLVGKGAGIGATLAVPAGPALKGAGALAKTAASVGSGAALAAAYNPGDQKGEVDPWQITQRLDNAKIGALVGAGGAAVSGAGRSLGGAADVLQQKAMGLNKFTPGVGTTAINEGIRGTRAGMQDQVAQAIEQRGSDLQDVVNNLKGKLDSSQIAESINKLKAKFQTPEGMTTPNAQGYLNTISDRAKSIQERGSIEPSEALALKRIVQREGYNNGEPLGKFQSQLAQKEAQSIGSQLQDLATKQGAGEQYGESNKILSHLLKGQGGLEKSETLGSQLGPSDLVLGGLGGLAGGPAGGAAAVIAKQAAKFPIVQSYGAKALQSSGNSLQNLNDPKVLRALLEAEQEAKR